MGPVLRARLIEADSRSVQVFQEGGFSASSRQVIRAASAGAKWDAASSSWFFPYRPGLVLGLEEASNLLGMPLSLDRSLSRVKEIFLEETEKEWAVRKLIQTYIDAPTLEIPPYVTADTPPPWRHQRLAWHWGMRVQALYLAHKMGLGKTRSACDLIRGRYAKGITRAPEVIEIEQRVSAANPDRVLPARYGIRGGVLIVCPQSVSTEWIGQLWKWQSIRGLAIVGTPERKRRRAGTAAWVHICSFDSLESVEGNEYDLIIGDELHCIANQDSDRFKRIWVVRERARSAVGMSGTPQSNGLVSLWSQYYFLDGGRTLGPTFEGFKKKYFSKDGWAAKNGLTPAKAISNAISRITWPLTMDEAFAHDPKPPKIHLPRYLSMTDEQKEVYLRLHQENKILLGSGKPLTYADALARITKLMQVTQGFFFDSEGKAHILSSAKLMELEELLSPKGELADKRCLVWCTFLPEVDAVLAMLKRRGIKAMRLKAGMSPNEREAFLQSWNNDATQQVCVGTVGMGIGLNMHAPSCVDEKGEKARVFTTVFYGMNYRSTSVEQAMDRVYRGDQVEACSYIYLMSDPIEVEIGGKVQLIEPIDVRIYNSVLMKMENQTEVNDDSVEYIRSLLSA